MESVFCFKFIRKMTYQWSPFWGKFLLAILWLLLSGYEVDCILAMALRGCCFAIFWFTCCFCDFKGTLRVLQIIYFDTAFCFSWLFHVLFGYLAGVSVVFSGVPYANFYLLFWLERHLLNVFFFLSCSSLLEFFCLENSITLTSFLFVYCVGIDYLSVILSISFCLYWHNPLVL